MKRMKWIPVLVAAAATLMLAGTACGDDDNSGALAVKATLKEWSIALNKATVPAGQVTIRADNQGTSEHELILLKTDIAPDKLQVEVGKVDEKQFESPGEVEAIKGGTVASRTFKLDPGHYLLICNIAAHYEQGMRTELTVQ